MIKLSKDELARTHQIVMDVWNAIAPDLDTGPRTTNLKVVYICMDYVEMYAGSGREDLRFMMELFDRIGFEQVCKQIAKNYCYY